MPVGRGKRGGGGGEEGGGIFSRNFYAMTTSFILLVHVQIVGKGIGKFCSAFTLPCCTIPTSLTKLKTESRILNLQG